MLEELQTFTTVGAVLIFVYASLIGSFLNVVIYRWPLERSIVYPGSACGTCGTPLEWWENLPIIAYLYLGGRCKTCGSHYSCRYALVELFTALTGTYLYYLYDGFNWQFTFAFVFFCFLLVAFFTDLDHWIILDSITYGGMFVGLVGSAFIPFRQDLYFLDYPMVPEFLVKYMVNIPCSFNLLSSIYGILLGAGFYWAIQVIGGWIIRQEAMGSGDIKLAAMIGAFLGWHMGLISYFMSFILGALVGVAMMLIWRKRSKDPLPLGTFMTIAAFLCLVFRIPILQALNYIP